MSRSNRQVLGRFLARIGAMVRGRRAVDAARAASPAENPFDNRTIDQRIENLGSASNPERAVGQLVALGKPALLRLLDVFNNKVSVPRGPSDRHASIGRNQAITRLVERHPDAVLQYFETHNSLSPGLRGILSASSDSRVRALAAQAVRQHGWVKLPEFKSTAQRSQRSEPDPSVDHAEIDRWIENLGSGREELDEKIDKVVCLGEPALRRLIQISYREVSLPKGPYWKDQIDGETYALARLAKRYPDLTLELVRGRQGLPFPVIAAFRSLDDERFKMIADIASKNFGRVEGLTT
jgi:hypothetical protein